MTTCILIDNEALRLLKAVPTVRQAEYWAELLIPTRDFLITGTEAKNYSCYTHYELRQIYYHQTGEAVPDTMPYSILIQGIISLVDRLELDETPEEDLKARLGYDLSPPSPLPDTRKAPVKPGIMTTETDKPAVRPKKSGATKMVWDIADRLKLSLNRIPTRKEIIEACVAEEINAATASTQYGKWKQSLGA